MKYETNNLYFQEKYRHYVKGKKKLFYKEYVPLSNSSDKT